MSSIKICCEKSHFKDLNVRIRKDSDVIILESVKSTDTTKKNLCPSIKICCDKLYFKDINKRIKISKNCDVISVENVKSPDTSTTKKSLCTWSKFALKSHILKI